MSKKDRKIKHRKPATDTVSGKKATLQNPFLTSSGDKKRKSTSTIFNTAETGSNIDPLLISDLRKIASSPNPAVPSAEAPDSPSYKASERARMRQKEGSQKIRSSPPLFKSNMADYDDLDDIMNDFVHQSEDDSKKSGTNGKMNGIKKPIRKDSSHDNESDSDSGSESDSDAPSSSASESDETDTLTLPPIIREPSNSPNKSDTFAPLSPDSRPSLKRKLSHASASSSSDSEIESDDHLSTSHPGVKRIKPYSPAKPKSSTVASRNPFPPELLNGTIKLPSAATVKLEPRSSTPDDHRNPSALARDNTRYPPEVLTALRSLESVLPPYLDSEALRPAAESDDITKLVTVLDSAKKLIVHLSVKKLGEGETDMQTQMVRIAKQREGLLRVMEGDVTRLLAKGQEAGGKGRRRR